MLDAAVPEMVLARAGYYRMLISASIMEIITQTQGLQQFQRLQTSFRVFYGKYLKYTKKKLKQFRNYHECLEGANQVSCNWSKRVNKS